MLVVGYRIPIRPTRTTPYIYVIIVINIIESKLKKLKLNSLNFFIIVNSISRTKFTILFSFYNTILYLKIL